MGTQGYAVAAFRRPRIYLLLAVAAFWALAANSVVPLLCGVLAALLWVGVTAHDEGFRRRVDARRERERSLERARRNERLLAELPRAQREHFLGLQRLAARILDNFGRLETGGPALIRQSRQRLDALLHSFLRLSITLADHRRHLAGADRGALERECEALRIDLLAGGCAPALREIKERRVAILQKRIERFDAAGESREVIAHQLASIEDLLLLLHEQSITLRDPSAITLQLDALAIELEEAENTIRELDRLLAIDPSLPLPTFQHVG